MAVPQNYGEPPLHGAAFCYLEALLKVVASQALVKALRAGSSPKNHACLLRRKAHNGRQARPCLFPVSPTRGVRGRLSQLQFSGHSGDARNPLLGGSVVQRGGRHIHGPVPAVLLLRQKCHVNRLGQPSKVHSRDFSITSAIGFSRRGWLDRLGARRRHPRL
jgi:hypothetical protein